MSENESEAAADPGIHAPEPHADTEPEATANPGGTDAVDPDPDNFPLVTTDQPQAAQVDDDQVPDELHEPEEMDESREEQDSSVETGNEEPAG